MRGPVLAQGGNFICKHLDEIMKLAIEGNDPKKIDDTLSQWGYREDNVALTSAGGDDSRSGEMIRNLLVVPAECNFGGDRPDVAKLLKIFQRRGECIGSCGWATMLDLAKAASTGPVDLKALDPDFACASFYKIFGAPTGLGVLFVKRSSAHLLTRKNATRSKESIHHYFGGGSVDVVIPTLDFAVGRGSSSASLASFAHGTVHFRGIASLSRGFQSLDRIGGMGCIRQHAHSLATELTRRLKLLQHGNGRPAILIYGAWAKPDCRVPGKQPGPTIAFNIVRRNRDVVGYNEVAKLAALNHPPLQLRTGCFCNPGACQEALKISDDNVKGNYKEGGHVCGDHNDIIGGNPTGAIRASFGKDSIWEDLDALVVFLERHFVDSSRMTTKSIPSNPPQTGSSVRALLTEMYIFPIKSCAAHRVPKWKINVASGRLLFDREFALVDSFGTAMRLQKFPKMSTIQPIVDPERRSLTVAAPGFDNLVLNLDEEGRENEEGMRSVVSVCGNKCLGKLWGDLAASEWFSSVLGVQCWLARYSAGGYFSRHNKNQGGSPSDSVRSPSHAFANEKPILLISKHAVDKLNTALLAQMQPTISSRHFRPNFVVECNNNHLLQAATHPEDCWEKIKIRRSGLTLHVCGHCARCTMVDIDPTTGTKGNTLRALADYRKFFRNINFGVFLQAGSFETGDLFSEENYLEEGIELLCN
jgi:molybdenum cofactor sulfurtransferase